MKKNLSLIAVAFFGLSFLAPAHAISHAYRAQLERSGCTQVSDANGECDIHASKAQNKASKMSLKSVSAYTEGFIGAAIGDAADTLLADGWKPNNGDWFKAGHQIRLVVEDDTVVNAQVLN